jgi:hypothetical protein
MDNEANQASGLIVRLSLAEKLVALLAAASLGWTTYQANTIANQVSEQGARLAELSTLQELEIDRQKFATEQREADVTLTHKIYQEFIGAITDRESEDAGRIDRLSAVLVLTDAIPAVKQREGMARAVKQAIDRMAVESPQLVRLQAEVSFDAETHIARAAAEQKVLEGSPPSPRSVDSQQVRWSNYDFDIFWCDGVPEAAAMKAMASEIAQLRSEDSDASGRWRIRSLPANVNERSAYNVSGLQIRYSSADEKSLAEALKSLVESRIAGARVDLQPTPMATAWYLSVFVCP